MNVFLAKRLHFVEASEYIPVVVGVEFVRSALMLVLLPTLGVHLLGKSMAIVGIAISAHYLMDNALRPLFGYFADGIGAKALLGGGLLLSSASMILLFSSRNSATFILAAALFGAGTSSLWPVVISRLTERVPVSRRARALSVVYAAWLIASGCGPVIANSLPLPLDGIAIPGLTAILLGSGLYAVMSKWERKDHTAFHMAAMRKNLIRDWKKLFIHIKASKWLFPGMYVQTMAIGLLIPVIAPYSRLMFHDTPEQVTFAMLIVGGLAITALPLFGRLVDRFGARFFLVGGFFGFGVSISLFAVQRSFWFAALTLAMAGVCYAMILPAWNTVLDRTIREEWRAAMWGFFMMVEGMGTATGPVVSGELWVVGGPHAPFLATGIIVCSVALIYTFLRHPGLARHPASH